MKITKHGMFTIQRFPGRLRDWSRVESYSCINYWPQHLPANLCKSIENTDFNSLTIVRIYRVHTPCTRATCHRTRWTPVSRPCNLYRPILTGFVCMDMQKHMGSYRCGQQKLTISIVPVSLAMQFKANTSKFFTVFDCLIVLIDCSDAEMSRSGHFCVDKPIALPLVHVHGVTTV